MSETARPPGDAGKSAPMAAPTAAPAPAPPAKPEAEAAPLNVTVPGGKYAVPGQEGKFVNALGEPVDAQGKKIEEK